jgi:hypothetical protein
MSNKQNPPAAVPGVLGRGRDRCGGVHRSGLHTLPVTIKGPPRDDGAHAVSGMPGWQITLIALGAALLAATAAVVLDPGAGRPPGSCGHHRVTRPPGGADSRRARILVRARRQ